MVLARSGILVVGMGYTGASMGSGGVGIDGLRVVVLAAGSISVWKGAGESQSADG